MSTLLTGNIYEELNKSFVSALKKSEENRLCIHQEFAAFYNNDYESISEYLREATLNNPFSEETIGKLRFRHVNVIKKIISRITSGILTKEKQNNIFLITDAFESDPDMKSLRWLAYILATSMHESNDTFAPVVEGYWIKPESKRVSALYNYYAKNNPKALRTIFPNGKSGTAYYGRGRVVQLTHNFNYKLCSEKVFGDARLFADPDLIIKDVNCDMQVTFKGMLHGWFTGYRLEQFFP